MSVNTNIKWKNVSGAPGGQYVLVLTSSTGTQFQLMLKWTQIFHSGIFDVAEHEYQIEKRLKCILGARPHWFRRHLHEVDPNYR